MLSGVSQILINSSHIFRMFGAQTYGTLINTLDKLATVPLFLVFWGTGLYGEWLVLRAIPAYLAIAELGFATAAANRMSVLLVKNQREQALGYFQTAFLVLFFVSAIMVSVVMIALWAVDVRELFNFSSENDYSLPIAVYFLLGYTLLIFQTQLLSAAYRAVGRYVYAAYFTYHIRAVELIAIVIVIISGGGVLLAGMSYFLVRLLGSLLMAYQLLKSEDWLKYGWSAASWTLMREMLPDALAFLAFPLGQAMSLQGAVFIIANLFSPAIVAIFSASRVLSRTLVQFGMQINRSVWPELTRLSAAGNKLSTQKVYLSATSGFIWIGLVTSIALLATSPLIFNIWTAGRMEVDITLFGTLLFAAMLNGCWYSAMSVLAATDRHKRIAACYVVIMSLSLILSYFFGMMSGSHGVALALVISEAVILTLVLKYSLYEVEASLTDFFKSVINAPKQALKTLNQKYTNG